MTDRDAWICADEATLLAECEVQTFRGSGPGGQHRNTTSSAVRVRHRPTDLTGVATNKRSQVDNRREAILELRRAIVLMRRQPVAPIDPPPGPIGRLLVVAQALDALEANGWSLRAAAAALETTTGQLVRRLSIEPEALTLVNARRRAMGLKSIGG